MKFTETDVPDVLVVSLERRHDERGFFARAFCVDEFAEAGVPMTIVQSNVSSTRRCGTVRGMHLQVAPALEAKLVRCTRGAIFDVAADLRPESPTYGRWIGVELTEDNGDALYVPEGCAHGFQTLTDDAAIRYDASAAYMPEAVRGARHDDPLLDVRWPLPISVISTQDRTWPPLGGPGTTPEPHPG
jgi:dTDP-4-dehydrorhamnose 3,5-epimerase